MELEKLNIIDIIVQDEHLSEGDRIDEIALYCEALGSDLDAKQILKYINQDNDIPDSIVLDQIADYTEKRIFNEKTNNN